jgi:hypothetical protein
LLLLYKWMHPVKTHYSSCTENRFMSSSPVP